MAKRDDNIVPLKDAIDRLLKTYKMDQKMDEISIQNEWEKLMSKAIVNRTKKITLQKGILKVQIDSSVVRHELNFMKNRIIEKFNKQLGKRAIRDVIFY